MQKRGVCDWNNKESFKNKGAILFMVDSEMFTLLTISTLAYSKILLYCTLKDSSLIWFCIFFT